MTLESFVQQTVFDPLLRVRYCWSFLISRKERDKFINTLIIELIMVNAICVH